MTRFHLYFDKDKETEWLNQMAEEGYAMDSFFAGFYTFSPCEKGEWQYPAADNEVMVLHTLIVSVRPGHRGSGKEFLKFYEEYAREHGCRYLRLDTNARNQTAREFYRKHEYREIGIVPTVFNGIPGVDLVLLEKKLQVSDPDRETET